MFYQDQIQTPHKLYEFAKQNVPSLNVEYFNIGDWEAEGKLLESRFAKVRQFQGMAQVSNALEEWLQRKNRETIHSCV